jgi:hypothetical protein
MTGVAFIWDCSHCHRVVVITIVLHLCHRHYLCTVTHAIGDLAAPVARVFSSTSPLPHRRLLYPTPPPDLPGSVQLRGLLLTGISPRVAEMARSARGSTLGPFGEPGTRTTKTVRMSEGEINLIHALRAAGAEHGVRSLQTTNHR